ncbi:3,4-dihydroxy-2-butanone-4-phosphate synthase [Rhodospirillum rubrum]|uniref:3,4-dihydroxy-2-butanone-4-phosphate synthase n=1 Tax=Rhodospirillum rubrum TaxID=1085 RepID=UPI0019064E97|nr:3,4-dihydroxy-2-butanone-4-phosphate synthase [Rhodospirillum rubrum]MBK1664109.1 3,4-dihydroxy-2-butanone-4-phosphate synthase [Rhodospirillum rubrum]MBK1675584.1 3,4-dihydroxy-2-butanone-4-phosphate synthase [Rhodospirillum rubrum]
MNQIFANPLSLPGTAQERVSRAVDSLRRGQGVIVVDDEDRENEGDLIFAAETLTAEQMSRMIRDGSGIVCLILTDPDLDRLALPPMVAHNTSRNGTGFTVSIEARQGVTTGVSAADRVTTIRAAIDPASGPDDLARPGHVFPLRAHADGLSARRGHTEATIALMGLAGLRPAGVLCEVMNPDGTMARLPTLIGYGQSHDLPIVSIEDLVAVGAH